MPEFTSPTTALLLWAVIGYAIGSISFGILLARVFGLGDLRQIGSGNIGATNVLRTGNKTAALLTLLLDAGKGGIIVLLARWFAGEDAAQIAGLAAFLGHCFPVWLNFKGGKGVATYFGILFALNLIVGAIAGALWLIVAAVTRYSSLAALIVAGWLPVIVVVFDLGPYGLLLAALGVLIYIRHRPNIKNLKAGIESKIGQKD
jgi:glycerol-3-phosphate acyltransferase PlsY